MKKQRATIVSIAHLNKSFEVKITDHLKDSFGRSLEDDGNVLLPIPKDKFSAYFEVGDEIELKKFGNNDFKIINLTCDALRFAKFKRDLISILRRLDNAEQPLKRCVLLSENGFVLLSANKNADKVRLITEATQIIENNHEKF
jgi:hypothetical protein